MFWFCQVVSLVHVILHLCGLLFVQLHSAVLQSWISLSFLNPFSALVICVLQICPCVNSSNHCEKLFLLTECEALFLYSFPSAAVSLPALCSVCEPQVLGHSTLALSLFLSLFYSLSLPLSSLTYSHYEFCCFPIKIFQLSLPSTVRTQPCLLNTMLFSRHFALFTF